MILSYPWVGEFYYMCVNGKFKYSGYNINNDIIISYNDLIVAFVGDESVMQEIRLRDRSIFKVYLFIKHSPTDDLKFCEDYPFPYCEPEKIYQGGSVTFYHDPRLNRYERWDCGDQLKALILKKLSSMYEEGEEYFQSRVGVFHKCRELSDEIRKKRTEDNILLNYGYAILQ